MERVEIASDQFETNESAKKAVDGESTARDGEGAKERELAKAALSVAELGMFEHC